MILAALRSRNVEGRDASYADKVAFRYNFSYDRTRWYVPNAVSKSSLVMCQNAGDIRMSILRLYLTAATLGIYSLTVIAIMGHGWLWPVVAFHDLVALNWRTQFDFDFLMYLILSSVWISWREGATSKAYLFAFLNVFLGGMFAFPYLLVAIHRTQGDAKKILLGVNA